MLASAVIMVLLARNGRRAAVAPADATVEEVR